MNIKTPFELIGLPIKGIKNKLKENNIIAVINTRFPSSTLSINIMSKKISAAITIISTILYPIIFVQSGVLFSINFPLIKL